MVSAFSSSLADIQGDPKSVAEEALLRSLERHAALLPPIPSLVMQIQERIDDPWIDLRHLTRLIRTDPNIAGPLLRLANSVFHRGDREIFELEVALQRIGVDVLRMIVLALGAQSASGNTSSSSINGRRFRFHALLVATVATHLGRAAGCGPRSLERLWMAGLLHDQGAHLLPLLEPAGWNAILSAPPGPDTPTRTLLELERERLPWDHAQVGAAFLERKWSFPSAIVRLIRHWPAPEGAGEDCDLAEFVRRADLSAQAMGHCWQPGWTRIYEEDDPGGCRPVVEECLPLVRSILPAG